MLEDTLVNLTSSEKQIAEDRSSRDSEIREQEERANVSNLSSRLPLSCHCILISMVNDDAGCRGEAIPSVGSDRFISVYAIYRSHIFKVLKMYY